MVDAFNRYRPEVVFHAAAHKHVPVLERHPVEAASTNVFGTLNVVAAATGVGVQRFVQISTDKAVRPSSVMGASKRIAEQIVLSRAPCGASYCTVRFGNVLGSRGSVIPTFTRQIANGGPVTVTDERMTRFFMSVEEAVQLVLESSVLSDGGGEIFMLEMGEPVRILDLAERMIRLSGYQVGIDIPIEIVGMRPGEKFDEELRTPEEAILTTYHPYINQLIPITAPERAVRRRPRTAAGGHGPPRRRGGQGAARSRSGPCATPRRSGTGEPTSAGSRGPGTRRTTGGRRPRRRASCRQPARSPRPAPSRSRHEPPSGRRRVNPGDGPVRLVVVGQGYVGLPLALRAVDAGFDVVGFDLDADRVKQLAAGSSYVEDISRPSDWPRPWPPDATSPPTTRTGSPGSTWRSSTCPPRWPRGCPTCPTSRTPPRSLAGHLRPGATVVLESTSYPGTTEELVGPILEDGSGLLAGRDFHLGYSPERIDPGNPDWRLENTPKVVSGIDAASLTGRPGPSTTASWTGRCPCRAPARPS